MLNPNSFLTPNNDSQLEKMFEFFLRQFTSNHIIQLKCYFLFSIQVCRMQKEHKHREQKICWILKTVIQEARWNFRLFYDWEYTLDKEWMKNAVHLQGICCLVE